jgi:hypothetical protein
MTPHANAMTDPDHHSGDKRHVEAQAEHDNYRIVRVHEFESSIHEPHEPGDDQHELQTLDYITH